MAVTDIARTVCAVAGTEFLCCILTKRFIFQGEKYTRSVSSFERAKARRDKTAASLAAKQKAIEEQIANPGKNKKDAVTQKSIEKETKKLQRENEELSALAAEVARRHTMAGFYSSLAFLILYRILAAEYSGKVLAVLPFEPFNLLQRITFRGLGDISAKEVDSGWKLSGNTSANASQSCAFAFIYILCSLSVKMMVNMAFGTKPPQGADEGVRNLLDAPQGQKMMKNFGIDVDEVKEARKAVGF